MIPPRLLRPIIFALALVELAFLSFWKGSLGPYWSSIVLLISGLFTGIVYLYTISGKRTNSFKNTSSFSIKSILPSALIFAIGSSIVVYLLQQEIQAFPITDFRKTTGSDVIPQIGIMVERFRLGEFPYEWISQWAFGHSLYPTYLPMTWMPYLIPDTIGIDYRMFALLFLIFTLGISTVRYLKDNSTNIPKRLITVGLPFIFLILLQENDNEGMFKYAVETLIAGYYILLCFNISSRSTWLIGISLVLCLMSRYSIVLWLPIPFLVLLLEQGWKTPLKLGLILLGGVAIIYGPFLLQDPYIFSKGYAYHTDGAIQAWKVRSWQPEGSLPFNLYKGLGFCWVAVEHFSGDLTEKVGKYQTLHLSLTLMSTALLSIFYFLRRRRYEISLFLLGSLKIYLVVFYNFIQIPFGYLFFVPLFVSIPLLWSLTKLESQN